MELIYKTCYGLTTVLGIIQGVFILYKNPRSRINVTWALTSLAVAIWSQQMLYLFADDYQSALLSARAANYAAVFIPVFFSHFCLALLNKPLKESKLTIAAYIYAFVLGPLLFSPWFVPTVSPKLFFRYYAEPGPLYVIYTVQFFALAFYSHFLLLKHLHSQPYHRQNQIKWIASATVTGFICGSTTFLLVYGIPFNPWPSLFTSVYALVITYAIVKYQVLDIKVAITRTGVFLGTYLIVLGIPFMVGFLGENWLKQEFEDGWWLVPLGLCTVLATIGPFAYAYLRRKVERALLKEQRRYQRTLLQAARGMTRVRDLTKLTRLIVRGLTRIIGVQHASLFILEKEARHYRLIASDGPKRFSLESRYVLETGHPLIRWLKRSKQILSLDESTPMLGGVKQALVDLSAAIVVPGFVEDEMVGFLALGEKLSGTAYSTDDLNAFSTLAHEAAVAIENACSYEELLRVNEHLRLANDRLIRQERLAAAGQFATGMAHEIKNPLSAIKTFAEYLPEKYQDPDFRGKFFKIVQSEIDRINGIVKELLEFAKPTPLQLQPVHLSRIVEETLTLFSDRILRQGVELHKGFHVNGLTIQADSKQLKQVVLNLLLNSLEAMENGGRLDITTTTRDEYLILKVSDSGSGISDEDQRKLFDPFFTTKERGMGLGLAVVKGIVERHDGSIYIRSQQGQGTTVEIHLPISQFTH